MDITSNISSVISGIQEKRNTMINRGDESTGAADNAFSSIFDQMINLVGETDALSAQAEKAEIEVNPEEAEKAEKEVNPEAF